jgi:intracellular sulfur oxidation DsrE/DsrF family protein
MRYALLLTLGLFVISALEAQEEVNPVVKDFGGIYAIPEATVTPDPSLNYQIVVDVFSGAPEPDSLGAGLNNVARMLNLHAVGGVPPEQMEVVLAIHGRATFGILDNDTYRELYGMDNPNAPRVGALKNAGVKLTVCGQSLLARGFTTEQVLPEIEVATSMLTTVAMYQLRGFAVFRF